MNMSLPLSIDSLSESDVTGFDDSASNAFSLTASEVEAANFKQTQIILNESFRGFSFLYFHEYKFR